MSTRIKALNQQKKGSHMKRLQLHLGLTQQKMQTAFLSVLLTIFISASAVQSLEAFDEKNGQWDMGTTISYIRYEEPDFIEEKGAMFGIFGRYTYRSDENAELNSITDVLDFYAENKMFALDSNLAFGSVDYESVSTGTVDNIFDLLFEIRGLAGIDMPVGDDTVLTPYLGFGFRYLFDGLGGKTTTTGHVGFDRESRYYYLPFGIETLTQLDDVWSFGLNVEYDLFLSGKQESHLEDVAAGLSTLENDQDNGFGVRGSVKLIREGEKYNLLLEPFVRYWQIDESNIATITCGGTPCAAGVEPKNNSFEVGARVGVRF